MELVRDLLDQQAIDRSGERLGKVDSVILELRDGAAPRVAAVEIGLAAAVRRLDIRWLDRLAARLPPPARIPMGLVIEIGRDVRLDVDAEPSPATAIERWLRDRVVARIPGSGGRPARWGAVGTSVAERSQVPRAEAAASGARRTDGIGREVRVEDLIELRVRDPRGHAVGRIGALYAEARGADYVVESVIVGEHPVLLDGLAAWSVARGVLYAIPLTRPHAYRVLAHELDLTDAQRPRVRLPAEQVKSARREAWAA